MTQKRLDVLPSFYEPATKFVMLNNRVSFFPFFPKGVRTLLLNTTIFGSI